MIVFGRLSKDKYRTFLVEQWIRIRLPMQGTWVQWMAREDFTCSRAAKFMHPTAEPELQSLCSR